MIDYSGLQVCRYRPARAVVVLMLMHYVDGDLGQYLEYGTNVMVNPPGSNGDRAAALQSAGAFIHHLPVDQAFTLEAGRTIWGYPKVMARLHDSSTGASSASTSPSTANSRSGWTSGPACPCRRVFTGKTQVHPTYSHLDGVTRETAGEMRFPVFATGPAACASGSANTPTRKELGIAGFPKRAMISSSADNVEMTFGDAKEIA